jgi:alpha-amylase/alpha-mannosidase (GH57 family)
VSVVRVAFVWHMHQPSYRDPVDGSFVLPWVRLHALKDYLGMVELVEETPDVHVTFNLVPSLVDQIEAYVGGSAREHLQEVSLKPAEELDEDERVFALRNLFMVSPQLITPFARMKELLEKRGPRNDEASLRAVAARFTAEEMRDLQLLSKLAWFDLNWREKDEVVRGLAGKGRGYSEEDKSRLAEREAALLAAVIPAYRRAAERGQVELSASPYYHPILPLLCDTDAHREAHPQATVPRRYRHPEDAAYQIRRAMERHAQVFGAPPAGMWPSEGSVSEDAVREMARAGLKWTASDEGVLQRSVNEGLHRDSRGTAYPLELIYRPWLRRTEAGEISLVFRDRALSDLIGFSYSAFDPERAATDLLERLRRIGERWRSANIEGDPVVAIILDGENAWEHFADGGRRFLRDVYRGLASDARLAALTVSEALEGTARRELPRVFAGSWIHADFSVWIGHADDRRAWELLGDLRDDLVKAEGRVPPEALGKAWELYRAACGSDWCWWYGEDHSSENDLEFDSLFRRHLRVAYETIGVPVPPALDETIITARRLEVHQSRPTAEVQPVLDGEMTAEEWLGAGVYRVPLLGAMHRGLEGVRSVRFGIGGDRLYLLVEATVPVRDLLVPAEIAFSFRGPKPSRYRVRRRDGGVTVRREERGSGDWSMTPTQAQAAAGEVLEVAIPIAELAPDADATVQFRVLVLQGGAEMERHPEAGPIALGLQEVRP